MLNALRQEPVLQKAYMNEEKDASSCDTQDMSLTDDAMSDLKHRNILVPQVIVSCAVFVCFVCVISESTMEFVNYMQYANLSSACNDDIWRGSA
jgi:hypothetical protein